MLPISPCCQRACLSSTEESALSRRLLGDLGLATASPVPVPEACSTNIMDEEMEAQGVWKMNDPTFLVLCIPLPPTPRLSPPRIIVFLNEQKKEIG